MSITNDPCNLLNRLLKEKRETAWIEFKENNVKPEMIGQWISACANAAILEGKTRAFLVYGIEDVTLKKVGTDVRLNDLKKGNENFTNWINRMINPNLMMEFLDFEENGKYFSILCIEPSYDRPVKFENTEYIRIGENIKKLKDFPPYERSLWMATNRRKFEDAIALPHQTVDDIIEKIDIDTFYKLSNEQKPNDDNEIIRRLLLDGFLIDDMEGGYDITNLGAVLLAKSIKHFPSIETKSIRVIKYSGINKSKSDGETVGDKGYAVGFSGLLEYVMKLLPSEEVYRKGIRSMVMVYPETAVREIIANALIHQDFTVAGTSPVIEIYSNRIEVTNPGNSLIDLDRIIDERQSRNEKLASKMRLLGLCEERGGGLDKALIEIEKLKLPAFKFEASENSMRVILFGPKDFKELSKQERIRACFFHCILKWIDQDYMSNSSLRERFSLEKEEYQSVSTVISEAISKNRIKPADPDQGNRYAKYVPPWVKVD